MVVTYKVSICDSRQTDACSHWLDELVEGVCQDACRLAKAVASVTICTDPYPCTPVNVLSRLRVLLMSHLLFI